MHRHDVGACELAVGGSSSTAAVATRQERHPDPQPATPDALVVGAEGSEYTIEHEIVHAHVCGVVVRLLEHE